MHFIIEAGPELLISFVLIILLYLLTKDKLSTRTRTRILLAYAGGVVVTLILLFQSNAPTVNTLDIQQRYANSDSELSATKDLSPKTLSSEESSQRLSDLIEEQKESVSVEHEDSDQ